MDLTTVAYDSYFFAVQTTTAVTNPIIAMGAARVMFFSTPSKNIA